VSERIVFNTSTLVGAVLRPESVPHQALRRAFLYSDVCASAATLAELNEVLERPKFDRYLDRATRREAAEQIRRDCLIYVVPESNAGALNPPCRDPNDNKLLALALAARASIIISSDEDLLILHPWRGIPILTPAQFLSK
jgi:putative PIN family toxin of toxin-antitoxin system